jgi:hypothetical protein
MMMKHNLWKFITRPVADAKSTQDLGNGSMIITSNLKQPKIIVWGTPHPTSVITDHRFEVKYKTLVTTCIARKVLKIPQRIYEKAVNIFLPLKKTQF